jgi:DNA-binding MarR family transcriptional regulator
MSLTSLSTLDRTRTRRVTDLAATESVTQPTMTARVKVLERVGLAERRGDPTDRRETPVALTEGGSEYVRAKRRSGADAFVQLIEKLPADEAATLTAAIPALEHLQVVAEPATRSDWHEDAQDE